MMKLTIVSALILFAVGCITPSQKRNPAQATSGESEASKAITQYKETRHNSTQHVPHAPRKFTPVDTSGEEVETEPKGTACGDERWDIKTLTDAAAEKDENSFANNLLTIMQGPPTASVAKFVSSTYTPPKPWTPTLARMADEAVLQKVAVQIIEYKLEADHDYHIVITDLPSEASSKSTKTAAKTVNRTVAGFPRSMGPSSGPQTMIIESPDPQCPGGIAPNLVAIPDIYKNRFVEVRAEFDKIIAEHKGPAPQDQLYKVEPPIKVFVTGYPFFDKLHGQTGVAPNGIEIHPILDLEEDIQAK